MNAGKRALIWGGLALAAALIAALFPSAAAQAGGEDCIPYNPASLYIVQEGDSWLLTDGAMRMNILDNEQDAQKALAVAQQHTNQCFIGRNNTRPNRKDFIVQYWTGNSGISVAPFQEDCLPFNPANVYYVADSGAWLVTDGVSRMLMVDTEVDAQSVKAIIDGYGFVQHCFIGRDNTRPNRGDYIFEYWKGLQPVLIDPGIIQISPGVLQAIATEDCLSYDPNALYIVQEGDYWLLTDGAMRMNILDNQADAQEALAVARNHTVQCFIGRNNTRANRKDFIVQYWGGTSGLNAPQVLPDCLPYNPAALYTVQEGDTWLMTDGVSRMLILDNQTDANAALAMAQQSNAHCFVGRSNTRPNRDDFIFEYWVTLPTSTPTPVPAVVVPPMAAEDCIPYNPGALYVVQENDYWLLTDGAMRMVMLDNQADANLALAVAQQHTQQCFIGRNNTRPNRSDFIMAYWK